jgi:hypothetical protein
MKLCKSPILEIYYIMMTFECNPNLLECFEFEGKVLELVEW